MKGLGWSSVVLTALVFVTAMGRGAPVRGEAPPEYMVVTGVVHRAGSVDLDPFLIAPGTAEPPPRADGAAYAFELLDARGAVLARADLDLHFEMEIHGEKRSEVQAVEATPFAVVLPHPIGVARARLRHGERMLAERIRSAHAPTVTVIESRLVNEGREILVRWRADDRDGDDLTYRVSYARNGTSFETRASDLGPSELRFPLDVRETSPGAEALVRVRASDGWNFAEATAAIRSAN